MRLMKLLTGSEWDAAALSFRPAASTSVAGVDTVGAAGSELDCTTVCAAAPAGFAAPTAWVSEACAAAADCCPDWTETGCTRGVNGGAASTDMPPVSATEGADWTAAVGADWIATVDAAWTATLAADWAVVSGADWTATLAADWAAMAYLAAGGGGCSCGCEPMTRVAGVVTRLAGTQPFTTGRLGSVIALATRALKGAMTCWKTLPPVSAHQQSK